VLPEEGNECSSTLAADAVQKPSTDGGMAPRRGAHMKDVVSRYEVFRAWCDTRRGLQARVMNMSQMSRNPGIACLT
jgi:hypothetical protein